MSSGPQDEDSKFRVRVCRKLIAFVPVTALDDSR